MEKIITYFDEKAKVACDENCNKAWGGNNRPRVYEGLGEQIFGFGFTKSIYPDKDIENIDDWAYLSDNELGDAPENPRTEEGGDLKPTNKDEIGNRWCVRECERCVMSKIGEWNKPLQLKDLSKRYYNYTDKNK